MIMLYFLAFLRRPTQW